MPAFGDQLSETDVMNIIAYIKTMWTDEQRVRQQQVTDAEASE
jgi:mono/diheme cytochrome c family protein